jgi:hypothetical protein
MKTPVLSGAFPTGTVNSTRYISLSAGLTSGWQATRQGAECAIPLSGTFRNLRALVQTAPGAGQSWTFKLYVNGADTLLSCTISDANTTGSDLSNAVAVTAGDLVCWKSTGSATAAASGNIALGAEFEANTSGTTFCAGVGTSSPTTGTQYMAPVGYGSHNATENNRHIVFPTGGTIDRLRVEASAAPGAGTSRSYTLRKNAADTTLTCSIADTAVSSSDLSNSVTVAAGDMLAIAVAVTAGTPSAGSTKVSFRFTPTVSGESVMATAIAAPSSSATSYENANGNGTTATEANAANIAPIAFTWKKLYLNANTAPGAAKSFAVTSRINAANGGLTATLSGAGVTTANDTSNTVAVSAGDLINWITVPSGTPTSPGILSFAAVAYVAPAAGGGGANGNLLLLGVG